MYLSITGVENNKLTKYQPFETEAEAIVHAKKYNGFTVKDIGGNQEFWIVDKDKKTITFDKVRWDSHQEAITSTQYQRDRLKEYNKLNQFEMMFDDKRDGTTTWVDKINEIKQRHPK